VPLVAFVLFLHGMNLKDNIKLLENSKIFIILLLFKILKSIWFVFRFCTNGRMRSEIFADLFSRNSQYQRATFTINNRYPLVFQKCTEYFASRNNTGPKILSFGCSTGEEVFTLGEYFPQAKIIGVDINSWCIRQCKKMRPNPNFSFYNRKSKTFEILAEFDAIFCMAVFQRTENRTSIDNQFVRGHTFEQFESEIKVLDSKLKVGGLFIIDHSDFSFTDTSCAFYYKPHNFEQNQLLRRRPLYNKNDQKIANEQTNYRVFEKVGL
jgi:Methyltransferase domain